MSAATVLNWLVDVENGDIVHDTNAAVLGVLSLIRSDLVDVDHELEVFDVLDRVSAKRSALSSGEQVLLDVALSIWRGAGGAYISDLGRLDNELRKKVLAIVVGYYLGACS